GFDHESHLLYGARRLALLVPVQFRFLDDDLAQFQPVRNPTRLARRSLGYWPGIIVSGFRGRGTAPERHAQALDVDVVDLPHATEHSARIKLGANLVGAQFGKWRTYRSVRSKAVRVHRESAPVK